MPPVNRLLRPLDPRDPPGGAAVELLRREAAELRRLLDGGSLDLDPEYLHGVRVGIRRVRAALHAFEPWLEAPRAEAVRRELGERMRGLGRLRDLDVLLARLPRDLDRLDAPGEASGRVLEAFELRRRAVRVDAAHTLGSMEFRRAVDAISSVAAAGGAAPATLAATWPRLMAGHARKLARLQDAEVAALSDEDLHRLRIAIKRLRYLSEFLAGTAPRGLTRAVKRLALYQDLLGRAQDARVAAAQFRALARALAAERRPDPEMILVLGGLVERQRRRGVRARRRFEREWERWPKILKRLERSAAPGAAGPPPEAAASAVAPPPDAGGAPPAGGGAAPEARKPKARAPAPESR